MFFPVTEAETRQKLLRNVKKEVRCILFLYHPPHHSLCLLTLYVFTGVETRLYWGLFIIKLTINQSVYNQPVSKNSGLKPPGVFLTGRQNDYDDDSDDDDDNNTDDDDGVGGGGFVICTYNKL